MTLMEDIYAQMKRAELTPNAEAFSQNYLNRSRSWMAQQRRTPRACSLEVAINCLRSIRRLLQTDTVTATQQSILKATERQLLDHLRSHHHIAQVV